MWQPLASTLKVSVRSPGEFSIGVADVKNTTGRTRRSLADSIGGRMDHTQARMCNLEEFVQVPSTRLRTVSKDG